MTNFPFIEGAELPTSVIGRPSSERLAALDDEAARAVIAKDFINSHEAAKHFAIQYSGIAFEGYSPENKKTRLRDIRRRIDRRRLELLSPST